MNGATLRTYRELLGYELNRYAEKLGVNRRTVTRWETGEWPLPDDVATQVRSDLRELNQIIDELGSTIQRGPARPLSYATAETMTSRRSPRQPEAMKSTTQQSASPPSTSRLKAAK